jgi:hypothetical protein
MNLALGKAYKLDPAPNYSLCTDPGDLTQLTDGQYVKGYFWTQKGTVGWSGKSPVAVTIDLEKSQPIGGLSFDTAAGAAGVEWPAEIFVLVSEDATVWNYAGDLVALSRRTSSPPVAGYAVHRFRATDLATRGRFIKFLVEPSGPFTFVDEIEVYPGPLNVTTASAPGPRVTNTSAFFKSKRIEACLRRRLSIDLSAVAEELASSVVNQALSRSLRSELDSITGAIPFIAVDSPDTFTTVFPINELHRRIFAVQAGAWRAKGLTGIVIWQSNRWDMLSPTGIPIPGNPVLSIPMMSNEYRADAFNLSNAGETSAQVFLALRGLPGETTNYVTVYEVPFTDTKSGAPIAAALVPLVPESGRYLVRIPSGLTRQVWFTFHPTNVPVGDYIGSVSLECAGVGRQVPVELKVHPLSLSLSRPTNPAPGRMGLLQCGTGIRRDIRKQRCVDSGLAGAFCRFALGDRRGVGERQIRPKRDNNPTARLNPIPHLAESLAKCSQLLRIRECEHQLRRFCHGHACFQASSLGLDNLVDTSTQAVERPAKAALPFACGRTELGRARRDNHRIC